MDQRRTDAEEFCLRLGNYCYHERGLCHEHQRVAAQCGPYLLIEGEYMDPEAMSRWSVYNMESPAMDPVREPLIEGWTLAEVAPKWDEVCERVRAASVA